MDRHRTDLLAPLLCALLCLGLLCGCSAAPGETAPGTHAPTAAPSAPPVGESPSPAPTPSPSAAGAQVLPDALPLDFLFASGVGGWGTDLTLRPDGTFEGYFHDSEMGTTGEDYPNGSVYVCAFHGYFSDIVQLEEGLWSLTLRELTPEQDLDEEWIEDGVRYLASTPYGLERGTDFLLYSPDTAVEGLSEDLLSWWPGRWEDPQPDTLGSYCLYNVEEACAFFS